MATNFKQHDSDTRRGLSWLGCVQKGHTCKEGNRRWRKGQVRPTRGRFDLLFRNSDNLFMSLEFQDPVPLSEASLRALPPLSAAVLRPELVAHSALGILSHHRQTIAYGLCNHEPIKGRKRGLAASRDHRSIPRQFLDG